MTTIPKVDVHHHVIPPQLVGVGEGMKGMQVPKWKYDTDVAFCEDIGVKARIFSVSTPGVSHIQDPGEAAKLARAMNEFCADLKAKNSTSCGFFATVPSLVHTQLALAEIRHAFDQLAADGVTLFTSYGPLNGYLGHEDFVPIWEELNARKAVVFVHPCNNGPNATMFNEHVSAPTFDWPHETGRTAIDMIVNKRMQQFPAVKIILSHAGGTLPALVRRATMMAMPEFGGVMSAEEIYEGARAFYFDTALAGSQEVLPLISTFARKGHLLFGSDYPHAYAPQSKAHSDFIDQYPLNDAKRKDIYYEAALDLFPRLREIYKN
ncbi:amidohydrolase family protein [Phaeosphaeria sp. MPI-PUGE-AT-0046c]|nr:amidohydrolase family protein [Phaeosphaeria sp. MPI-PUGE-AT-0046c]